ncbi:hypothetical protein [Natrinema amylolyticum]|uniref:hypothetical protein n=1 Tax=Natrinema amylolyticum TaxID=2878679 RepID=UPI001CF96E15|nr:hypothetical protein [Natrinema amylolyticum]
MKDGRTTTLDFQLDITEGRPALLTAGMREARRVVNEIFRLDKEGWDWNDIEDTVVDRTDHVKNTTQRLHAKATEALEAYYDDYEYGRPRNNVREPFPIRMNHGEGYDLSLDEETGDIHFRITALKYQYVRGTLTGSPDHLERLRAALRDDSGDWRVGTAEVVLVNGHHELHVNVTRIDADVREKTDSNTVVGVDINEDCIALATMTRDGDTRDSVVIEYPEIKKVRHEYFTKRKRMQVAGQTAFEQVVQTEERDFVHDQLHKVSWDVVD